MAIEVKVPVLPESVSDATIASWHKQPGDVVKRDENLVDLETDKVVLEVPSPVDGVIKRILKQTGDTVTSQELLAVLEEVAAAAPAKAAPAATPETPKPATPARATPAVTGGEPSPAARRVASESGIDPSQVSGSGRDGRVIKEDLVNYTKTTPAPRFDSADGRETRRPARVPRSVWQ